MAKLPLNVSTASNKRSLDNDDVKDTKKRKSAISKSTPMEKSTLRTITTVIGKVPLDAECKSLLGKAHVYCEDNDVFDCMLNQVEIRLLRYKSHIFPSF